MKCIFKQYITVYYKPDREYISIPINLSKLKKQETRLRINAFLLDLRCGCFDCNPYTGN